MAVRRKVGRGTPVRRTADNLMVARHRADNLMVVRHWADNMTVVRHSADKLTVVRHGPVNMTVVRHMAAGRLKTASRTAAFATTATTKTDRCRPVTLASRGFALGRGRTLSGARRRCREVKRRTQPPIMRRRVRCQTRRNHDHSRDRRRRHLNPSASSARPYQHLPNVGARKAAISDRNSGIAATH
jgi:hypothetical protein